MDNQHLILFLYCFCISSEKMLSFEPHLIQYTEVFIRILISLSPFADNKFLDSSKLKEFPDDNFDFNENGRKFSKSVENNVRKGEIASYEQFLLFRQCFQRLVQQTHKKK